MATGTRNAGGRAGQKGCLRLTLRFKGSRTMGTCPLKVLKQIILF